MGSRRPPRARQSAAKQRRRVSIDQYLRSRKSRRRVIWLAVGVLLVALIVLDRTGWPSGGRSDWMRFHGRTYRVVRVVDGDTIDVVASGAGHEGNQSQTRVRLWGIDAPEMAKPAFRQPAEPLADEAKRHLQQACLDRPVTLWLESHRQRGKFGRLLAYVQLPDGAVVNELMVVAGLARADMRFGHRWLDRYKLLEMQAKRDRLGLWGWRAQHVWTGSSPHEPHAYRP